jgi:predicted lipoprotein with Yx(FWY)xxD motif
MTRALPLRRLLPVATLLGAALALAACGSGGSSTKSGSAGTGSSSPSTTTAKTAAVILAKQSPDLGMILTDAQGRTVYTLTNGGKAVACTGACLGLWPPVMVPSGDMTANGGPGVKGLGVTSQASGEQVTSNGLPLYTYSGDTAPGMTNGENLSGFGGTWHVVKVSGAATSSTTPTTTKPSSSSSNYGY